MASIDGVPIMCGEREILLRFQDLAAEGGRLGDLDLTEVLELTCPLMKVSLDLSCKQAPDLQGTELYSGGNVHRL